MTELSDVDPSKQPELVELATGLGHRREAKGTALFERKLSADGA